MQVLVWLRMCQVVVPDLVLVSLELSLLLRLRALTAGSGVSTISCKAL